MSCRLRPLLLVALLAAALVAGGCGGRLGKGEYEREMGSIGKDVRRAMSELEPSSGHQPAADDIASAADALGKAASSMGKITPPEKVEAAHERMARGLGEMQASFDRLASAFADAHSDEERTQVYLDWLQDKRASKARDDIAFAQQRFQSAGYAIFRSAPTATSTAS